MEKDDEIRYSDRNNQVSESDMVKEEVAYGVTSQGDYTLEDYYAIPDERRVELIDGVIYDMAAPSFTHQLLNRRRKGNVFRPCHQLTYNWTVMIRQWFNQMLLLFVTGIKLLIDVCMVHQILL